MRQTNYDYDAFISHAVEDKIPIANELCAKLERAGLKIWYSGNELGIGDSIEKTIEKGLNRSRYGIVIFSPTYLAKNWTIREFYTLLAKEIEEQKVILPVLYNITVDELKNKDLLMADRFAVSADRGIDFVVERLVREIKKPSAVKAQPAWFSRIWVFLVLSLLANAALLLRSSVFSRVPPLATPLQYEAEAVDYQQKPTIDRAFLGQIEGLFSQLNNCRCNRHQRQEEVPARDIEFVEDHSLQPVSRINYSDREGALEDPDRPGRKMTMAVVFQIETVANQYSESGPEDHNAISFRGEKDPFVNVRNVERSGEENRCDCSRTASLAE